MAWDFSTDPEFQEKLDWMRTFVREEIWPLETIAAELEFDGLKRAMVPLQEQVRDQGLWAAHLDPELGGQGFGQVKLGLMHEILGSSPIAPFAFGNAAPDSGNSEILALAGTPEQKDRYLHPLLAGDLRSAFSMTEPETAGSDPTLLRTRAVRDGDDYVISGHKWFSSNGSIADFLIVMAVTDPDAHRYQRASMFLVDADTPRASRSCATWRRWSTPPTRSPSTATTPRSATTTCACPGRRCSAPRARASSSPSSGSTRAASTTACAGSASPGAPSTCSASTRSCARRTGPSWPTSRRSRTGSPIRRRRWRRRA